VYSGSSYAVIYLVSVFFKLTFIFIFVELLQLSFYFIYFWRVILIFSSFGSAVVSFIGAYRQNSLKRWLAYSTINQMGFILLGLVAYDSFFGMRAVIFYILSYLFSVTIFFSVISYSFSYSRGELTTLNDLAAFCKGNVFQAACTTVVLFSLAGLPPFIGFFGKYFILLALFDSGLSFVLFIFFLFNAFSVYYYIRLVQIV
jgi:NADH-quinone oxidoreductase subunit N